MTAPTLSWTAADGSAQSARWHSESGLAPPRRVEVADDTLSADSAYRLACAGTGMLWRGDFQNARHLLQAMARRVDRKSTKASARAAAKAAAASPAERFHLHRQAQCQRARTVSAASWRAMKSFNIGLFLPWLFGLRSWATRAGGWGRC